MQCRDNVAFLMTKSLDPFRLLLIALSGWMNEHQLQLIDYVREENRVLREQLAKSDFQRSVVLIQKSAVGKHLNRLKSEYSQDEVPVETSFILVLKEWQELCGTVEQQWVFPSPLTGRPYRADSIRGRLPATGSIGFHMFRHTYRAWLDETGAAMGVQQKLMRRAQI